MKNFKIAILLFFIFSCQGNNKTNIRAVNNFQVEKYLGTWYEIARLDHSFERGCTKTKAVYSMRTDGGIDVVNSCIKDGKEEIANGKAYFNGLPNIGSLKVSFFGPFYGNYNIIYLDKNYQYALVDGGSYDYFWILSRKQQLDKKTLNMLLEKARLFGFETSKLIYN